jgi:hypothetical protein
MNRLKCALGVPVSGISRMDEKRIFWLCNVDEMMWEKSMLEGRKADRQKIKDGRKTRCCEIVETSSSRMSAPVYQSAPQGKVKHSLLEAWRDPEGWGSQTS